jgi:hypothetical protein
MIDTQYVIERLSDVTASDHALARQLGITDKTVQRLRDGRNHADMTLRMLGRIGDIIGADLVVTAAPTDELATDEATPDDVMLEAALLHRRDAIPLSALARILGWRMTRALAAADRLQRRLAGTGARLRRNRHGLAIEPRAGVLDGKSQHGLVRQRYERRGLGITAARALYDVLLGRVDGAWSQHASYPQRVALAELINAGLVTRDADGRARPARALANSRRLTRPAGATPASPTTLKDRDATASPMV